ncbi:4Fe-4S dicluster domain-containing protein [Methanocella sp. MCL-LM]|uniref:4Fe-4S dicluster domain-containing protein n=1 Tax=Methanocella sp. MCL-LM TaxID=3412035 RepID=UPI003C7677B0
MATRIRLGTSRSSKECLTDSRLSGSGFEKCMQCGRCTASCPAAYAFDDYLPRVVMSRLALGLTDSLIDAVWRCGQCYSCRARCPRNNSVGEAVLALREKFLAEGKISSEIKAARTLILKNLYRRGETFLPQMMTDDLLREFGPATYGRCAGNLERRARLGYEKEDARACRIPEGAMAEIRHILNATGCSDSDDQK